MKAKPARYLVGRFVLASLVLVSCVDEPVAVDEAVAADESVTVDCEESVSSNAASLADSGQVVIDLESAVAPDSETGMSAFHDWAGDDCIVLVEAALDAGIDVNSKSFDEQGALHFVRSTAMMDLLIGRGADATTRSESSKTPPIVLFAFQQRADLIASIIPASDNEVLSKALVVAIQEGCRKCVESLVGAGVNRLPPPDYVVGDWIGHAEAVGRSEMVHLLEE